MVAKIFSPLRGTETLREAQGGKEEVGEGEMRKRRNDRKKNLQRKEQEFM